MDALPWRSWQLSWLFSSRYAHMLNLLNFIFVLTLPFVLLSSFGWATVLAEVVIVVVFYGLQKVAVVMLDPFGKARECYDLTHYGTIVHNELLMIARVVAPNTPSFATTSDDVLALAGRNSESFK